MSEVITINNTEIPLGQNTQINFQIARLPTHTMVELPVHVYRASVDGPVLLLTAALHGNELNGIEVIRRMMADKTIIPDVGTVIAIPIVNVFGFLFNTRELPDRKDLNRSFPGQKKGTLAQQVAFTLMNEVLPHIDYGIDFHTGGEQIHNYPQIRCVMDTEENRQLASYFAPPLVLNSTLRDRSFRKASTRIGKTVILYEAGESMRWDEFAIEEGINGTLRVMHELGMRSAKPPAASDPIWIESSRWIRASHGGLFRPMVEAGDHVKKGQVLGVITDPFGEFQRKIKANSEGVVVGLNHLPVIHRGVALIHFGMLT